MAALTILEKINLNSAMEDAHGLFNVPINGGLFQDLAIEIEELGLHYPILASTLLEVIAKTGPQVITRENENEVKSFLEKRIKTLKNRKI